MGRPREFDEDQVVQSAMQVFWRQGYRATSVQDLVDATGLQRGSLYAAFTDKHGLYTASLDLYILLVLTRFRGLVAVAEDPAEAVRDFVRQAGIDSSNPTYASRGCLVGNTCTELAPHDPSLREPVAGFVTTLRDEMAEALRRAQALGTFDPRRDPVAVATMVQCGLQGLAVLLKSDPAEGIGAHVISELLRSLD